MSLLLDARKKIELALQHSDAHINTKTQPLTELDIEDFPARLPGKSPDEPSQTIRHTESANNPRAAPARGTPEGAPPPAAKPSEGRASGGVPFTGERGDPRAAGENLFAAKTVPAQTGKRLGIIPIALISGLVLAAGGGYYVWREISPPPVQRHNPAPPPATPLANATPPATPLAIATPPAAPVTQTAPAPATSAAPTTPTVPIKSVPAENKPALAGASMKQSKHAPRVAAPPTPPAAPHNTTAQPIHIEHVQDSDAVDPDLLAAWQSYRSGDFDTARQRYSEVLHKNAQNRDALLGMAAIAQQQSQDATAARYYRQVLTLDPRDPTANAGMSSLLVTSNVAGAESRLKLLLAQQPPASAHSASLHFALGNLYAEQLRWGDAQQAYFNAFNLEQDNAQFAFNLAVSLDHLGQGKLAAQHYQRALQLDISDKPGFNRAQAQQRINELTAH